MVTPVWEIEPGSDRPRIVHVNATSTGGGVAEILHGLVDRQQSDTTDAGWAVIGGTADFYAVTKYLHHLLHGNADPGKLDDPALPRTYRDVLAPQAAWFAERLRPGDVVVLHDPQTLGLAPAVRDAGARVVWHCHVGTDVQRDRGPAAFWRVMDEELAALDAVVTTLPDFAPPCVPAGKRFVVPPAIDPGSPKNRELSAAEVTALLAAAGLTADSPVAPSGATTPPYVEVTQEVPLPRDARVVLQVSRWDPLKDMPGVVRCVQGLPADVHLVLAGTNPTEIPDDPEGLAVLAEVRGALGELAESDRARVHLVSISMRVPGQNALLVNALQRRADVVVQKSLAEGFGLTVTEAMIKARPVVAAAVGGIRRQVIDGRNGLLVDPTDLDGVRAALVRLLDDPALRRELGDRARADVLERYTIRRLVEDYARIVEPSAGAAPTMTTGPSAWMAPQS